MNTLNGIRTSCSYSQLIWVVHLLQNFLTLSIVILTSLQVSTEKIFIDIMFAVFVDCLSIGN